MVAMKNALQKDTLREIRRTLSRFLSIFAIVALGVAFFAGIKATASDMRLTGDRYFDEYKLMDIKLLSTMGFDEEDISAIKGVEGVEALLPSYSMDAIAEADGKESAVKVLSLPESKEHETVLNKTKLIEGRYPERADECVVEKAKMFNRDSPMGSKLLLSSGTGKDILESLQNKEYTIVGIVETPYYVSYDRGTSSVGNGKVSRYMMIPEENFKLPVYTEVFLTAAGAREVSAFEEAYEDIVGKVRERLEETAKIREVQRYEKLKAEGEDQLAEGRNKLLETEKEALQKLRQAEEKLGRGREELAAGKKALDKQRQKFEKGIGTAEDELTGGYAALEQGQRTYEQQLAAAKQQGAAQLAAAEKKLQVAQEGLQKGEQEYQTAKQGAEEQLDQGRRTLQDSEEELSKLEKPVWYVLGRKANPGYVDYGFSADRVAAIAQVFPVFFFLIAALVCLTTMTRMVDEQRTYIGTLKALGYSKIAIASKYLAYALLASVSGSIFGLLAGFKVFPTVIFNAYSIMFTMPPIMTVFNIYYGALSTFLAVSITTLAAWFACASELREEPAILMRPKAPKAGKRIFLERVKPLWSKLNFTQKITARNLFRYKKRFLMTVLGIGGCSALLLSGLGLKDSILSIAEIQFDQLYKYDMTLQLKNEVQDRKNAVAQEAAGDSRISDFILYREQSVDIGAGDKEKRVSLIVPEAAERLQYFIDLRLRVTHEKVPFSEDSVVLTEKLAKHLGVKVGDEIYIRTEGQKKVYMTVTGITEHYVSHYLYVSPKNYQRIYGKPPAFKQLMLKTADTSEEFENRLSTELLKNREISAVRFTTGISKDFKRVIKSLNDVTLVLILSAGALAFIVLYNLTNVNVTERIREIATIKVLGFFDREVSAYVDRESMILTFLGMLLGLAGGIFLHRYIVVTAEVEYVMFGRTVHFMSYVYAALLTMFFGVLVNLAMHFKLKKISMVESLKSVD
jgi:putative ABC transport system permease protein